MHPELAPIAFLAAFTLLLPLPWHWRAGNIATLSIIGWLFIVNMIYGIDAAVWAGNVEIRATLWCDITTKLLVGANFALAAACLCVCIHLEQVASVRKARTTFEDRRRRQIFELFMCLGLPIVFMALHYIVQGHRFDIIEDYGCRAATFFSIPSIFMIWLPPILMALGALIFAGLALRHFMLRRLTFAAHLNSSNSALTTSRYFRLMAMAAVQMFWSLTTTCYALWFTTLSVPIRPWKSWADVHSDFLRIDTFPSLLTPPIILRAFYVLWWLPPASTFLFIVFFAFGKDAMDEYVKCWVWFKTTVLRISGSPKAFMKFGSPKVNRGLPISSPTLISSSHFGATTDSGVSISYKEPFSPDSHKSTFDISSEYTHYVPSMAYNYKTPKALGSISDMSSPATPSTAVPPYISVFDIKSDKDLPPTPAPLTPPPTFYPKPRVNDIANQIPVSPRRFTYPSNNPVHHDIDMTLTKP